jgi:HPt (histidine-containing phosphotransfer) domain-containing protein
MDKQEQLSIFNRKRILVNVGGDNNLLKELCEDFLKNSKSYIESIKSAIKNNDAASLATAANKLKGVASNLYADRVKKAAFELEKTGESDTMEKADALYSIVENEMEQLEKELNSEITSNRNNDINESEEKEGNEKASTEEGPNINEISHLGVFNREKMLANVEGDVELLKNFCNKFLKESKSNIENIRDAITDKEASSLAEAAQVLKAAASALYAERVKVVAFALEKIGQSANLENADTVFSKLETEMEQLEKQLNEEVSLKDQIAGKKVGIFELIDELRGSIEASFVLRDALMKRLNGLENLISSVAGEVEQINGKISAFETLLSSKIIATSPEQEKKIKDFFKRFKTFALRYAGHVTSGDKSDEFKKTVEMLLSESKVQKNRYNEVLKRFKMSSLK